MNWLDIVILIVLAVSIFGGLKNGLINGALSLAGLIIGVVLAGNYYSPLAKQLPFIPQGQIAEVVAFLIILVAVTIIAGLLGKLLTWATSAIMLGWVNHLGGAIFGLVMGAISCSALLALWVNFFGGADVISHSALAKLLLDRFPAILALLPDEFDAVRSFFQ